MAGLTSAFPGYGRADWLKAAEAALKGASLETLTAKTSDGIPFGPLYQGQAGPRALRGEPGPWKVFARIDQPEAGDANAQAQEDLANGADGLEIVFSGAVGAHGFGLGRWDAASLERAFEGVRFDAGGRFELDLGPQAETQAEAFAQIVARSGVDVARTSIAFGLDPLGLRVRSGRARRPWDDEAAQLALIVESLGAQGFAGPFVVADGRPIHDAGGTPAQELAFALGAAVTYLRALGGDKAGAIGFRLAADADQFATLAKFRAVRLLWGRVLEASGLPSLPARVHASGAWRMMSARAPFLNVLRGGLAAFSAGLGGADSVALLPFSQAIGLPDAFARRLARNTQLVELRESRLGFVADPAAGAGAYEALTEALGAKAWALFQGFEREGGLPAALATGEFQRSVAVSAAALCRDVARLKAPDHRRQRASRTRRGFDFHASRRRSRAVLRGRRFRPRARADPSRRTVRTAALRRRTAAGETGDLSRRDRAAVAAHAPGRIRARMVRGGRHSGARRRRGGRRAGRRLPISRQWRAGGLPVRKRRGLSRTGRRFRRGAETGGR